MGRALAVPGSVPGTVPDSVFLPASEPAAGAVRVVGATLLTPLAALLAAARALRGRPSVLAVAMIVAVCLPGGRDAGEAVHVGPADVVSVVLAVAALAALLTGGRRLPRGAWMLVAPAVVASALATIMADAPAPGLVGFARYMQVFVLVPLAVAVTLRDRLDRVLVCGALITAGLVEGGLGVWQFLSGSGASFGSVNVRAVGTFGAAEIMGMATAVSFGFLLAAGLGLKARGRARWVWLGVAAVQTPPLMFSLSRGTWVALLCACVVMMALADRRTVLRLCLFGGAAAMLAATLLGSGPLVVGNRMASIGSSVSAPDQSVTDRYLLWRTAVNIWATHPVTGVGPRGFPAFRDGNASIGLSSGSDTADAVRGFQRQPLLSPHNMYLLVLCEQGVAGLAGFAGLLGALAVGVLRRLRGTGSRYRGGLGLGAAGFLVWQSVDFLYSDVGGAPTLLMSAMLGVAIRVGAPHGRRRGRRGPVPRPPRRPRRVVRPGVRGGPSKLMKASALSAVLMCLGSALGFGRDLLLAGLFGATEATDSFLVAWTVPETASSLLLEGALSLLLVPLFSRVVGDRDAVRRVVSATLFRMLVVLVLLSAATALAAPLLVGLLAPGLPTPGLAAACTRITAVTVVLFGLAGYLAAALRAHQVFGPPAAVYAAYNVGIVGLILTLHGELGVVSAALGVALGALLMVAVQAPAYLRHVGPPVFTGLGSRGRDAAGAGLAALVPIAAVTVLRQGQVFVERYVSSDLTAGTISHLNYAQKIAQVPMVLSLILATVTFPAVARSIAEGDLARARRQIADDLALACCVVLAATAVFAVFSPQIVEVLLRHGAFTAADTAATASIMRVYALGLLGQSMVGVACRAFFSQGRPTWYPALAMGAGLATTALVAVAGTPLYGVTAIVAANAAGITLTAGLLLAGLGRSMLSLPVGAVVLDAGRFAVAAVVGAGAGWLVARAMGGLPAVVVLVVGGTAMLTVFAAVAAALGAKEIRRVMVSLRKRGIPA